MHRARIKNIERRVRDTEYMPRIVFQEGNKLTFTPDGEQYTMEQIEAMPWYGKTPFIIIEEPDDA